MYVMVFPKHHVQQIQMLLKLSFGQHWFSCTCLINILNNCTAKSALQENYMIRKIWLSYKSNVIFQLTYDYHIISHNYYKFSTTWLQAFIYTWKVTIYNNQVTVTWSLLYRYYINQTTEVTICGTLCICKK